MIRRLLCLALLALPNLAAAGESVRFDVEVMAVLSRAGCNQGACHGNLNGKGGFKLSLRGEDPAWDFSALTRGGGGRRVNPLRPDASLVLRKATATVSHEGGRRFEVDSPEHDILRRWIAAGTPRDAAGPEFVGLEVEPRERIVVEPEERVPLRVTATWADGRRTDVTGLACFESANPMVAEVESDGSVRKSKDGETAIAVRFLQRQATARLAFIPARPGFRWSNPPEVNFIDRRVFAKLRTLRINPSEQCDDATFVRRAYIDAIGTLPTPAETLAFLADLRPDKRARLVDELLRRPEFADLWALRWCDLLRSEEKVLDRKGVEVFHAWVRQAIAEGRPLNEFARELVSARGSTYANPPANYYRALRDPLARAEATAQVFLGVRVQCARCHNHPFDRWTQDDYYRLAAFFPRVQYRIVENNRKDKFDKHEFDGEQVVWLDRAGEVKHPRTGAATTPTFLAERAAVPADADRLAALADWIADPKNPFFARTQANRVWAHLLGRGLVDPVDDFRATNPPSHPELLDKLAAEFAAHRFDLRRLVRTIMNSRTYQLSSVPNETNAADEINYSHALVRRLDAEVLLDAVAQVIGAPVKFEGHPAGTRALQLPGVPQQPRRGRAGMGERFMKTFGKPDRLLSCECERGDDFNVPQTLQLLTGELVTSLLQRPDNRIGKLLAVGKNERAIIEDLFLAALSRRPTAAETAQAEKLVRQAKDCRTGLEDVAWAVINCKEFVVRK